MADGIYLYSNRLKFVWNRRILLLTGYKTAEVLGDFLYSLVTGKERTVVYRFSKGDFSVSYTSSGLYFTFLSGFMEGAEFFLDLLSAIGLFNSIVSSFEDMYLGPFRLTSSGVFFHDQKFESPFELFLFFYTLLSSKNFKIGFRFDGSWFMLDRSILYSSRESYYLYPHFMGRVLAFFPYYFSTSGFPYRI